MINGLKSDEEIIERYVKKPKENEGSFNYSDYIINYETLRDKKENFDWAYEHASLLYLEYAENDFDNPQNGIKNIEVK